MRRIFFILIAVCLFAASSEGQRKRPRAAAPKISPPVVKARAESKNAGVSVERYVVDYVVNPDKTSLETTEILQRLTSPVMIARMSKISFLFNADLEEVKILDAYKISGGRRETISRDKIEIKLTPQAEAAPAFSSYKAASIDFGALKTGDAIYYKVQTFNKKAFFEGHFSVAEFFSTLFEWKSVEINLSAPVDYALNVEAVDLEGGRLEDLDKRARWQWRRANIPPRDYHPGIKSLVDTNPRLVVTSFKNYEELGRAYWTEAENKTTVTPEIQNLADEITKNLPERKEQAAAIYEWVNKNIRYLSIVLERGGWIPHSADSILKNGYGDCKDYVTILQALLKAKKIESEPVLINAEGLYWFPKIAPTAIFNHAILYVPELNVFADATAPNTRLGLLPSSLLGKSGILAGGRNGKITIPEGKPEDCRFLSDSEITFDAGGNLKSASKNLYVGRAEMFFRPMFADSRIIEDGGDFMKILLAVYGIDGTGKINEISNPHRLADPFTIRLEANIDNYTTFLPKGAVTIPQGLNLVNTAMLESLVRENKMKSELQVGATVFRENFKLKFPANVSITALAPNTKFTSEVGSFSAEYKLENNHVVVTRELIIAKDAVKPGEYAKFKELIEKAVEENNAVIGYQSQTDILREKFNNRKPAAANKKTNKEESLLESLIRPAAILKKLTPRQAVEIEKRIEQTPDDVQLRRRILKYYYEPPRAEAKIKAAIPHRVWLIQNFPDQNDYDLIGWNEYFSSGKSVEYKLLKSEWLKQVEANPKNLKIRFNTVDFIDESEWRDAEKLLLQGETLFPDNFKLSAKLFELYYRLANDSKSNEAENKLAVDIKIFRQKAAEKGDKYLALLKKERSRERDSERAKILPQLAAVEFDLEMFDKVKARATELVLEFGDDENDFNYGAATHEGNILLGRAALKEGNIERAKEYLLISARAPLRQKYNTLSYPNLTLAGELLAAGEKNIVLDFLKLCENFTGTDTKSLQLWQNEIRQGKTPDFKWY